MLLIFLLGCADQNLGVPKRTPFFYVESLGFWNSQGEKIRKSEDMSKMLAIFGEILGENVGSNLYLVGGFNPSEKY